MVSRARPLGERGLAIGRQTLLSGLVHRVEVKRHLGAGEIAAVSELLDLATEADHHHPLGEHQWLDLVQGGREGFAGLVAWGDADHPVGYAQVSRGPSGPSSGQSVPTSWAVELVVEPTRRETQGRAIGHDLLAAALDIVNDEGGGHVHLWVSKPCEWQHDVATGVGLIQGRDLLQMRRPLPVEGEEWAVTTRPFVPGQDEEAWLTVNNRAFAWHPEQGGWDLDTLLRREAEAWFDPAGFLLHEDDGVLAGFCWTKVHADHDPPLGEIYVIAVDPDVAGRGLGRALTVAGLDHLARRGIDWGMLYVDGGNDPAVHLYKDMGFTIDHVDRAYTADIAPR